MSGANTYVYTVKGISLSERKDERTGKKRKPQTLLTAARHNLREIQAEHGADVKKIDPTRTHLNERLAGPQSAIEVEAMNIALFKGAGSDPAKLRKDYVQASEHVLSLAPGQQERGFFGVVVACFESIYGASNILSATVHRDQKQPHIHILVSSIAGGKYCGGTLHDKEKLKTNKARVAAAVKAIGFAPCATWRARQQRISETAAKVFAYLEHINHPLLFDPAWPAWSAMIAKDPNSLFEHYELAQYKTPETISAQRFQRPIGIAEGGLEPSNLSSVGFSEPDTPTKPQTTESMEPRPQAPSFKAQTGKPPELSEPERVVCRDGDRDAGQWNGETGEFMESPKPRPSQRAAVDRLVRDQLSKIKGAAALSLGSD